MTIKKIYYFCEICKDLNLSHTAKRLYVTQQSLSYVIRTLEQDLKCTLFLRTANGLRLTEQGNYFYARCTHILEELDETCSALRHVSQSSQSNLRISMDACVYSMMMHMLPSRCNDCDVEYSYYGVEAWTMFKPGPLMEPYSPRNSMPQNCNLHCCGETPPVSSYPNTTRWPRTPPFPSSKLPTSSCWYHKSTRPSTRLCFSPVQSWGSPSRTLSPPPPLWWPYTDVPKGRACYCWTNNP